MTHTTLVSINSYIEPAHTISQEAVVTSVHRMKWVASTGVWLPQRIQRRRWPDQRSRERQTSA